MLLGGLAFLWATATLADGITVVNFNDPGTYTFIVPEDITEITVEVWGGGGRGGARNSNGVGGGGGGGAYSRSVLSVTPGSTHSLRVGAGAPGNRVNNPANGGDSWFGSASTVMARGGISVNRNVATGGAGGAADAGFGDVRFSGGAGANGFTGGGGQAAHGGGGGSSAGIAENGVSGFGITGGTALEGGGNGGNGSQLGPGLGGSQPGGGGGGARRSGSPNRAGGAGGDGRVRITFDADPAPDFGAVSQVPLFLSGAGLSPNIMLILDNSNTMLENVFGGVAAVCEPGPGADCVAGAASPLSKSEIIRSVGRRLITDYEGQVNLGLMAYQQNPISTGSNSNNNVILRWIGNRFYDVSFDPESYDEEFSGVPWDSATKRFRVPNPTSAGDFIHYNIAIPGYTWDSSMLPTFFTTSGDWTQSPFPFRTWRSKVGTSDLLPSSNTNHQHGYSLFAGGGTMTLTDSARARGVLNYGPRMVFLPFGRQDWLSTTSPGLGYLHTPIRPLDETQAEALGKKLAPQHQNYSAGLLTDPEEPVIAAGMTPLEGTLYTLRDYFLDQTGYFGAAQGRGNAEYPLPNSCDVNAAIWLTDGMPSVSRTGTLLGEDVAQALADVVDAAGEMHSAADVDLYVVGFAMPPTVSATQLDQIALAGGTTTAYLAEDSAQLDQMMDEIFLEIIGTSVGSAASVASNSTRLDTDTRIYQARFDSNDWHGQVIAINLNQDGSPGTVAWSTKDAGAIPAHNSRNILTWNGSEGVEFSVSDWNLLSPAQRSALQAGSDETIGQARLDYIRGSNDLEGSTFRSRSYVLGDIVNSNPYYVGRQDYGFSSLPGTEGSSYVDFRTSEAYQTRPEMVYVGANAGMLHGFDAATGLERMAYVPKNVFPNLAALTDPEYLHRYYVDGSPRAIDAYIDVGSGTTWRTILVGSTGAGGQAVFAIDVTNPASIGSDQVLWEYAGGELGYAFGQPTMARLSNGTWVALFGNGYDNPSHTARLVILNLEDGSVLRVIDTEAGDIGNPNGLSEVIPVSTNRNGVTDVVYAGDLQGNLWKFDLTHSNSAQWGVAYQQGSDPRPLFRAERAGEAQPITARPLVLQHPAGGQMVLFGTGQFFRIGDQFVDANTQVQSFYGIHDTGTRITDSRESALVEQSIIFQGTLPFTRPDNVIIERGVRVTTEHPVGGQRGWFIDLMYDGQVEGERSVTRAVFRNGYVVFSTLIPDPDPCGVGGQSWLMELRAFDGARPTEPVLDLDEDGEFDSSDMVTIELNGETITVPPSGLRPPGEVGIFGTPTVVGAGSIDHKYLSTTRCEEDGGGEADCVVQVRELGAGEPARGSWRQIR